MENEFDFDNINDLPKYPRIDIKKLLLEVDVETLDDSDEKLYLRVYQEQCKKLNSCTPEQKIDIINKLIYLEQTLPIERIIDREIAKFTTNSNLSKSTPHKTKIAKSVAQNPPDKNTSFFESFKILPKNMVFCIISSIILAIFYFIGVADLPIGYYTFLRIFSLITLAASIIAYALQTDNLLNPITYTQVPIAILFNPLAPIYLDKEIWIVFDIICGIAMLAIAVYIYKSHTSKTK